MGTLNDLYINGPEKTSDYSDLETSLNNNCRGQLSFLNGPEYAFKLDRTFSDCKTQKGTQGNMATYKNAIQASADVVDANGINSRKRELFLEFGCKFEADLTQATNIGQLGSTWAQDPADNTNKEVVINNGCAKNSGNLLETGAGQFSRFTFDKIVFDATGQIFAHCEVTLCNSPSTTCSSSCTGEEVTVTLAINV